MDNATRRQLIMRHKASGFPGSILDVFSAHSSGKDLIGEYEQQKMQIAQTPQEQRDGLRPAHQAGNTNASMAFPNVPPNQSFNTVGMKAPIDIKQYDDFGNLVKSYDKVPPGVSDLKMSSQGGTVIETPAKMQSGGQVDNTRVATPQPPQYQLNPPPPSPYRDQGTITPDKSSFNAWRDEDSLFENAVEFFDPTGITSWDDARRAYNSMKNRGASIPNLDEGLDMFGAIPLFGRAKLGINLAKGAAKRSKDVVNAAKKGYNYLTKGSDIINRVDAIEDEVGFLDQKQFGGVKKYQTGSFVAESTYRPNYAEQAFLNQLNTAPIQERILTTPQELQGTISQAPDADPEKMSVYKMLAEPMKALEYWQSDYNRERGMPTQAEWDAFGGRNPYDLVTSMYNPAQIAVDSQQPGGAFGAIGGLTTADDLLRSADVFKRYGVKGAEEAGELAYNLRHGRVDGVAEELANAGSIINQGAANAKQFYQDAVPAYSEYSSGRSYLNRLADNTLARHPELAATYKPEMIGSQAAINATDDFAERYLTSYRGVRANNPEQAAEYLTSPFGSGNRAYGEGIYSAPDAEGAMQHGSYVGQLFADPNFVRGQDPRYTMGRLNHLIVQGGQQRSNLYHNLGSEGFERLRQALTAGANESQDMVTAMGGNKNVNSFLDDLRWRSPDTRTGFMDDIGQRIQRGTDDRRLKPKIVQMAPSSEFVPTVKTIWGDHQNYGRHYGDITNEFFRSRGFKKYGGARKYQAGGATIPKWQGTIDKINQNWGPGQLGDTLNLNALEMIAIERMGVQNPMAVMDSIGYHETGPHQRMQYNAVQIADDKQGNKFPGDGRGKYMYDKPSTETAANRINTLSQNMGMTTPPFAQQLRDTDGTYRADTLSPEQQDMLILADMIAGDKAPFRAYGRGDVSLEDLWYHGHNRRDDEKDARAEFRESMRGLRNDDLNKYLFMEPKPNYFERQRLGGVRKYQGGGERRVMTMGLPEKVDVIREMAGNEPAKFADLAGTDFNLEWNNSPMAQQMLTESYMKGNRQDDINKFILSGFDLVGAGDLLNRYVSQGHAENKTDERNKNLLSASYLPSSDLNEFKEQYGDGYTPTLRAFFDPGPNVTVYNPNYSGQLTDKLLGTGVHERAHASDRGRFPLADFNMMQSFRSSDEEGEVVQPASDRYREYVQDPAETRARIMDMRRALHNQGVDVFNSPVTREQFDEYLKSNSGDHSPFGELNTGYSKDNIFKMLNAIAYEGDNNLPQNVAKRGGKLPMRKPNYFGQKRSGGARKYFNNRIRRK